MRWIFLGLLTGILSISMKAQTPALIEQMEASHKECLRIKPDSIPCSRVFFYQMDSMVNVIYEKAKSEVPAGDKAAFIREQLSWVAKKEAFFKKQDVNFAFNLQEGTWKREMIRVVYEAKADFILKRIKSLLKYLSS